MRSGDDFQQQSQHGNHPGSLSRKEERGTGSGFGAEVTEGRKGQTKRRRQKGCKEEGVELD